MKTFDRSDLSQLLEDRLGPCVSAYVPTVRAGAEKQENPIQFKNVLRDAEERLTQAGMRGPDARALLAPGRDLLEDRLFWQYQGEGLAVFAAPEFFRYYRLPIPVQAQVTVDQHFHLRPLLPLLTGDGRFFVLALSQKRFRILECTRDHYRLLHQEEVPNDNEDGLEYAKQTEQLQLHPGKPERRGERLALQHGQGTQVDDKKDRRLRYFHDVDARVHVMLPTGRTPLILVAIDSFFPLYREANAHPMLLEEGVKRDPESLSDQEVHQLAWPVASTVFDRDRQKAWSQYNQVVGVGRTSTDPAEIVLAAWDGRVNTLFVAERAQVWGHFDPQKRTVQVSQVPGEGVQDLIDLAALQTLRHDGPVYVEPTQNIPNQQALAAFFRY